ncbi:hypothetical protein CAMSH0001_2130 [Campylobacter showae RM3277]|uniref:Uncharacterized protein n=1 Tax=Campylobacter showae RM3277 TaxID=553219 RepID=C6RH34_9BACT|nr:hypothetical protein CAMSH0001_2130 [Campylobacter showae RM3277]
MGIDERSFLLLLVKFRQILSNFAAFGEQARFKFDFVCLCQIYLYP